MVKDANGFFDEKEKKLYEKIARFEVLGVTDEDTRNALGIVNGDLENIRGEERYKKVYARLLEEKIEERDTLNSGWDAIEEMALQRVFKKLQMGADPDYALKAAMVANKAQRKPANTRVIDANNAGQTKIALTQSFTLKLTANGLQPVKTIEQVDKKSQDFLPPEKIENMLTSGKNEPVVELDFMPEVELVE